MNDDILRSLVNRTRHIQAMRVKILLDTCSIKRRKGNLNSNNDDDMGLVNKNLISSRLCIEMK